MEKFSGSLWKNPQGDREFSTGVNTGSEGSILSKTGGETVFSKATFFQKGVAFFSDLWYNIKVSIYTYPWHSWIARQTPTLKVEGSNPFG